MVLALASDATILTHSLSWHSRRLRPSVGLLSEPTGEPLSGLCREIRTQEEEEEETAASSQITEA